MKAEVLTTNPKGEKTQNIHICHFHSRIRSTRKQDSVAPMKSLSVIQWNNCKWNRVTIDDIMKTLFLTDSVVQK